MLTDPQVVTVNAVAKSMPRVSSSGTAAIYKLADGTYRLDVSHQESKQRVRSLAKVTQQAVVVDPLTSANDYDELRIHFVMDRPEYGFTVTQCQQLVTGFKTWLTDAMVAQLFGQES